MNISTKTYLILLFIILSLCATARQINYETVNKTHDLAPLKISLSFLNFENMLTPFTAGIAVDGHVKDKLFFNFQLRQGYIRNFLISKDKLLTTQNESKGTYIEAGVHFPFYNKTKKGKLHIVTSSNGSSEQFFKADCEVRKYWALNAGVIEYIRPKYVNSDSSEYIVSNNISYKAPDEHFLHFNQSSTILFAGFTHRKIKKALVKSEGTVYRRFYSTKFYIDALVGATKVQDFTLAGSPTMNIDNAKQAPLGYRIGWQWDQMGVITGFEFGKMPGVNLETPVEKGEIEKIFKSNPYLNFVRLTFHFSIFNNDKNYKLKTKS